MAENALLGFIGVGVMGQPMAQRLLEHGQKLVVFDTRAEATAALAEQGALVADSPRAVADMAEVVFTSLPSPAVFKAVTAGAGGVIEGSAVRLLVDLSTVGPSATREVTAALRSRDIDLLDAPVSGGAAGARQGSLAIMLAGRDGAVARVRSLFDALGKVFVVGAEPGQGQLLKLLNNMLSTTAFAITAEAYVAGIRGGLDPQVMMSVINAGSGKNGATLDKFPKQVLPRTFDFGFPIASVCKDIGLAIEECQALGVPMWLGSSARQVWNVAAQKDGSRDLTELVLDVEAWADTLKPA